MGGESQVDAGETPERSAGRPRDASIDGRVYDAAIELFASQGWSGFSIEKLTQTTGVGKASIYRRWSTKEGILSAALRTRTISLEQVDTGNIRDDFLELVRQILALNLSTAGLATERLVIESFFVPALKDTEDAMRRTSIPAAREIIRRAVARGELSAAVNVSLVLNVLNGAASSYARSWPPSRHDQAKRESDVFARELVELIMQALPAD